MKIVIVGAGDVGTVSAQTLADIHDVLIVEKDKAVADSIRDRLSVSVYNEDGTNPEKITYAINSHSAELLLACTGNDAWNLFICIIAKNAFPNIKTVASIAGPDYKIDERFPGLVGVDHIITPELNAARKMYHLATLEHAMDYESLDHLNVHVCIFEVKGFHNIVDTIVMHLKLPPDCLIFGLYRDDRLHTIVDSMMIRADDKIAVIGSEEALKEFNNLIYDKDPNREFAVLGASIAGVELADMLSKNPKYSIKLVDKDAELCEAVNDRLSKVLVINADFNDPDTHQSESLFKADCTICASRKDEINLLVSMSGQKYHARKVVARYFKKEYEDIFMYTGQDSIISYPTIISNEITKVFIDDQTAVARMRDPNILFFSHIVTDHSPIKDKYLGDLTIPEGVRIVCIQRDEDIIYPEIDTSFFLHDNVIVFTNLKDTTVLASIFGREKLPEL